MKSRKLVKLIATAVMVSTVGGAFAGCSSDAATSDGGSNSEGKTVLKVQWIGDFTEQDSTDPVTGEKRLGVHVVETEFERLNPDIDVQFITMGWDDYVKKTQTMILSSEADVYQVPGIAALVEQDLLEPLQPYIDKDKYDLDIYLDGQVDGWKVAGLNDSEPQIYSLPLLGDTRIITYDKKLFDDWGVEYLSEAPTLEEIIEKSEKMTGTNPVTGEENYGLTFKGSDAADTVMNINEYLGGTWGTGYRMNELKTDFNSDTIVQAAEYLLELAKYAPEATMAGQGAELYGTENNNIAINLRSAPSNIFAAQELGLGERYGVSRLFINEQEGMGGMFAGSPLAIGKTSKNKDAAWEYIKFTSSEFVQKYLWENQKLQALPVIKDGLNFDGIKDDEAVTALVESMEYLWTPRYVYRASQPRYILSDAVESVMLGNATAKDALDKAQKEAEDWVSQQ